MVSTDIGVWLAAILTISVTSLAWRETKFSRWGEYTLMAAQAGVFLAQGIGNIKSIALYNIGAGKIEFVIPVILGLLIYTRYSRKYMWMSRYGMSILVGVGIGVSMRGILEAQITKQIIGQLAPLGVGDPLTMFNAVLGLVLAVCSTWYFIFTITPMYKGTIPQTVSSIARYAMVTAFGSAFAGTVMGRLNQYSGRLLFLLFEWIGL